MKPTVKTFALFLPAAIPPAYVLILILTSYVGITFWDEWAIMPFVDSCLNGNFSFTLLVEPHMGHRLVLNKIIYWTAYRFFEGHLLFVVLLEFLTQFVLLLFLIKAVTRIVSPGSLPHAGIAFIFSGLLFAPQMAGIWLYGFTIQQPLTTLAFVAAIFLFAAKLTISNLRLLGVIISGLLASLASANGLVVWPALVAMSFYNCSSWRTRSVLAVVGLVTICAYFYHLPAAPGANPQAPLQLRVVYVLIFLGSMFSGNSHFIAMIWGGVGLLIFGLCVILFLMLPKAERGVTLPWLVITSLPIASAVMGSFKRIAFSLGMDSRYLALSCLFWVGLLTSFIWLTRKWPRSLFVLSRVGVIMLLSMAIFAYSRTTRPLMEFGEMMNELRFSENALTHGYYLFNFIPGHYTALCNQTEKVLNGLVILKAHRLHPFQSNPLMGTVIGKNIADLGQVITGRCAMGAFTFLDNYPGLERIEFSGLGIKPAVEARGWILSNGSDDVRIYLVDEKGIVCGMGNVGYDSFDPFFLPDKGYRCRPWRAFVGKTYSGELSLRAYAKVSESSGLMALTGKRVMK